jgi:transposase InsO family protein
MSRKACCLDNAVMENSCKSLESWRVDLVRYRGRERAGTDIVNWIEGFHHHRRLHTAIGYRTSMQFERQLMAA